MEFSPPDQRMCVDQGKAPLTVKMLPYVSLSRVGTFLASFWSELICKGNPRNQRYSGSDDFKELQQVTKVIHVIASKGSELKEL